MLMPVDLAEGAVEPAGGDLEALSSYFQRAMDSIFRLFWTLDP